MMDHLLMAYCLVHCFANERETKKWGTELDQMKLFTVVRSTVKTS